MKGKIKYLSLFILVLIFAAVLCIFIFRVRIISHYRPEIKQVGTVHIKMNSDTSYINSQLEIKSKVFFQTGVDTIKYKIDLFDKTFLQSTEYLGIELPGYGRDTVNFLVKIPHRSLMRGIKSERKKGDSAGYTVNISLQISTPFWNGEIPFSRTAKIKIPHPPELELVKVEYKKVRLRTITANVMVKIINYTNVVLSVKEMYYSIKILKQGDAKGNYRKVIHIKPNGATIIILPIKININRMGKIIWDVLRDKDKYDYKLSMNAIVESTSLIKESFHIDLTKSGKMELRK
ncbi:MAG TPA: LEA type 2 family protein [Bacteroidia bacterium]|jgi:LEA14-like dessication related protein|nr:LEA type 2 family protein [Bacteroidia bacterium]